MRIDIPPAHNDYIPRHIIHALLYTISSDSTSHTDQQQASTAIKQKGCYCSSGWYETFTQLQVRVYWPRPYTEYLQTQQQGRRFSVCCAVESICYWWLCTPEMELRTIMCRWVWKRSNLCRWGVVHNTNRAYDNSQTPDNFKNALCPTIGLNVQTICPDNIKCTAWLACCLQLTKAFCMTLQLA